MAIFGTEKSKWFSNSDGSYVKSVFYFFDYVIHLFVVKILILDDAAKSIFSFYGVMQDIKIIEIKSKLFYFRLGFLLWNYARRFRFTTRKH